MLFYIHLTPYVSSLFHAPENSQVTFQFVIQNKDKLYKTTLLKGRAEVSMSQTLLLPDYCALLFHFQILGEKITKVSSRN